MGIKALLEAPLVGNARAAFGASWARRAFDGPAVCGNNSIGVLFSIHGGMGEVVYYARRASSTNLRGGLGTDLADVHVRARRVVDVVDGDVGEAVGGPGLEPVRKSNGKPKTPRARTQAARIVNNTSRPA